MGKTYIDKLVIATHNSGKITEISDLFKNFNVQIMDASSLNIPEPEETERTIEGNAKLKAKWSYEYSKIPSIADDSGLFIPLLNGEPGVYSARWAGPSRNFQLAFNKIEEKLNGVKEAQAYVACSLALVINEKDIICVTGECHGKIVFPPKGLSNFGGYDHIFIKNGMNQTFGEIDPNLKNSISHRAEAFKKLKSKIQQYFLPQNDS